MKKSVMLASTMLVFSPLFAQAEPYLGAKVGYTWLEGSCVGDNSCSDNDLAGGVYGGYNFSDMFALEAGYDLLGDFDTASGLNRLDDKMTALTLAPKLSFPLNDQFDLYGKLGAAWVDYDDVDDTVLMTALGGEFSLTNNWLGRVEYQRLNNLTKGPIDNLNTNSLFFGLTYQFGSEEATSAPIVEQEPILEPASEPVKQPEPIKQEVKQEPAPAVLEPAKKPKLFQEYGVELFDHDSSILAANSAQYFDWLVGVMKKYPQAHAQIIGHTDSRGSAEYNQKLSERRAQSVANYLYTQGIAKERITVRGMGEESPKASNDTAQGRMENRRVEVIIDEFEIQE